MEKVALIPQLKENALKLEDKPADMTFEALKANATPNCFDARLDRSIFQLDEKEDIPAAGQLLNNQAAGIYGGSGEVQLDTFAKVSLGLLWPKLTMNQLGLYPYSFAD